MTNETGEILLPSERKQWSFELLVPDAMFYHGWSKVWAGVTADVGNVILWDIFSKWGVVCQSQQNMASPRINSHKAAVLQHLWWRSSCKALWWLFIFLLYFLGEFGFLWAWHGRILWVVIHLPLRVIDCWQSWETHWTWPFVCFKVTQSYHGRTSQRMH